MSGYNTLTFGKGTMLLVSAGNC
uniref:Uncharacterized protein n=1 Tax=Suricata suricatta TaxID=37032 RepID=A0A673TGN4_SURSU